MSSLGADSIVSGGQTMNPSIEDLLNGVRAVNAENVILLPNNGNVILTAEQVDPLAEDCEVRVVPTRNLPQGISALLAFDPTASLDDNAARMLAAIATVHAVEVTHAVRDTSVNGHDIKTGDVLAVVDDEIAEVGGDYLGVIDAVLNAQNTKPELVTVYRGDEVSAEEADALVDHASREASRAPNSSCRREDRSTTRTCSRSSEVIHLVTDSTSDIAAADAEALGVHVVPLIVRFGNEQFRDGVDIDADEFYAKLEHTDVHPTTSQPSPDAFATLYKHAARRPRGPGGRAAHLGEAQRHAAIGDTRRAGVRSQPHPPRRYRERQRWPAIARARSPR